MTARTPEISPTKRDSATTQRLPGGLLALGLIAPLAGLGAGLIGALFRLTLESADRLRNSLVVWAADWGAGGFLLVIVLAGVAAAIAAWLVRRMAPSAAGSGIPRVMAVLVCEAPPAPPRVVPVKFLAGTLAIGSGLALGREGPSVQMGASIAYQAGRFFRRNEVDCRTLLAAGAGAGLATAFNAPIAGSVFVLEALVKRFEARIAIAALMASAAAIWVVQALTGEAPDFVAAHLAEPGFAEVPLFILLGIGAGLAGILYSRTLLLGLKITDQLSALPVEMRAALVGSVAGAITWFAPVLVGGGETLAQAALNGTGTLLALPLIFLFRLGLIACSVASGTPGGILVPFLALGAELGLWIGKLCALVLPGMAIEPQGFAIVGMAALFTAIVRAPLTAIVLVTEMVADTTMLLPMIVACSVAMLVPALLGDKSILDSLKDRLLAKNVGMPPDKAELRVD